MYGQIDHVFVKGIKAVVPTTVKNNLDYVNILGERRCKKQLKVTGVRERHVSPTNQTSTDLALEAAKDLLNQMGWKKDEIDVLIFATQDPLFVLPSTAFFMQKELGLSKDSMVFDMNLGCSGALVGIQTIASLLLQGRNKSKGLLLVADAIHDDIDESLSADIVADKLLFGSAGAAVALERDDAVVGSMVYLTKSDGNRYDAIMREKNGPQLMMDGEAVFGFGVNDVANDMILFKEMFKISEEDIDYYSYHQAQALMLDTINSICAISSEKELRSLQSYGNTSGVSVLLNLCANVDKLAGKDEVRLLSCAFGVGLSWSYMYMTLPVNGILPISFSDKYLEVK